MIGNTSYILFTYYYDLFNSKHIMSEYIGVYGFDLVSIPKYNNKSTSLFNLISVNSDIIFPTWTSLIFKKMNGN